MLIAAVLILGGITVYSIFKMGLAATLECFREMEQEMEWNHVLAFLWALLILVEIGCLGILWGKSMEKTVTIFTEKTVHIQRFGRKDKWVSYDEIGECIRKRKIRIQNGGMQIPYKGGYIPICYMDPVAMSQVPALLGRKCGIQLQTNTKFEIGVARASCGWSFVEVMLPFIFIFGIGLGVLVFFAEGKFTWESALECWWNPLNVLMLCFVEFSWILNSIFYFSALLKLRPWRKYVKVPFWTFLISLVMAVFMWVILRDPVVHWVNMY